MRMRILIAGGPKTGKTTLSYNILRNYSKSAVRTLHTDDLMLMKDWSAESQKASEWMDEPGPWIIEGVVVPRAVRKWLARNPIREALAGTPAGSLRPCERAIWLSTAHQSLSAGQVVMAKGCLKVWNEIEQELKRRGVEIERR